MSLRGGGLQRPQGAVALAGNTDRSQVREGAGSLQRGVVRAAGGVSKGLGLRRETEVPALEANFPNFTNEWRGCRRDRRRAFPRSVPLLAWRLSIGHPGDLGKVSLEASIPGMDPAGRLGGGLGRETAPECWSSAAPLKGATTPPCSFGALPLGSPTSPGARGASSLAPRLAG